MEGFFQWLIGLVIFILQIWAIIDVIGSDKSVAAKILWSLFILFVPLIGLIVYFLFGRERYARV